MEKLRIVYLYPRELNLYGDRGNLLCIKRRLEKRNMRYEITKVDSGGGIPDFDIMMIGGGQDREIRQICRDIRKKGEMLSYAIEEGRVVFAVCAGFQLLGECYETSGGSIMKMSGALPFYTKAGEKRRIGNLIYSSPFGKIAGFENHAGLTYLPDGLKPLGTVISGFGNDGCGGEGLLYKNCFCTYAHGPVLPKNPALADELILRAVKRDSLPPLDDEIENKCHNFLIRRYARAGK